MAVRDRDTFVKLLSIFINIEIHVKVQQDETPVKYTLKVVGKDYLVVEYGESKRIIPMNKILFVQIGSYPKDLP